MNAEELRDFCLSLPHVTEDVKWGNDLCFLIGDKMFCVTGLEGPFGASFKVTDEEFEELVERDGLIPAPYLARYKWVFTDKGDSLTHEEWTRYISQSYNLVKSKLPKNVLSKLQ